MAMSLTSCSSYNVIKPKRNQIKSWRCLSMSCSSYNVTRILPPTLTLALALTLALTLTLGPDPGPWP